ncbi:MAG TPA: cyclopropane-fatty-acyl-phospholipid synthase family protein, partial [Geminicoccaceae bacterium]|nr:cyclopropane-fatty-acyl-phospholipid synthase family protein [Geminicoccaceae bacterium]
ERAIRRFLDGGGAGFAEAYLDGDWDSPDLPRLLELLALNEAAYEEFSQGRPWYRGLARLQHLLRRNSRPGSRRNILAHYDLGNRFYELWLDRTMTYSAALFPHAGAPLEEAQRTKYRSLAARLRLQTGHRLLEIGCGWGGFAEFAAAEIGARITAITISEQQHAFAASRIQAAGLADSVDVRLLDYRDVEGSYDRIAAIEMFEAVGERYWPVFFGKLRECLAPGGLAGLQVITIADRYFDAYRRSADFVQRQVFPGGMLPSPRALREQIKRARLAELGALTFGRDYARTLAFWQERFQAAWPQIREAGFDQRFKRLWEYYLAYCEAGFRVGCTDVCQLTLQRP